MFVLYLMDNEIREYVVIRRSKRPRLSVMYHNESRWIVPGTVSLDD
jgi:hypothetical protein